MKLYNKGTNTLRWGTTLTLAPGAVVTTTKDNEAAAQKLLAAFPGHIVSLKDGEAIPAADATAIASAKAETAKANAEVESLKKQLAEAHAGLAALKDAKKQPA
jgi:hypothetical protein